MVSTPVRSLTDLLNSVAENSVLSREKMSRIRAMADDLGGIMTATESEIKKVANLLSEKAFHRLEIKAKRAQGAEEEIVRTVVLVHIVARVGDDGVVQDGAEADISREFATLIQKMSCLKTEHPEAFISNADALTDCFQKVLRRTSRLAVGATSAVNYAARLLLYLQTSIGRFLNRIKT